MDMRICYTSVLFLKPNLSLSLGKAKPPGQAFSLPWLARNRNPIRWKRDDWSYCCSAETTATIWQPPHSGALQVPMHTHLHRRDTIWYHQNKIKPPNKNNATKYLHLLLIIPNQLHMHTHTITNTQFQVCIFAVWVCGMCNWHWFIFYELLLYISHIIDYLNILHGQ